MGQGIIYGIGKVLEIILNMVQLLVLASVVISWLSADPNNSIVQMIRAATEPIYQPIRRHITGRINGPFDFAPLLVMLIIVFLQKTMQFYIGSQLRM